MWDIPFKSSSEHIPVDKYTPNGPTPVANGVLHLYQTKQELAQYLSATCFDPAPSTLLRAIRKQHMTTWPGLSTNFINERLQKLMHAAKGHLDQEAKNLRSTKTTQESIN